MPPVLSLLVGFVLLVVGGEVLVRGAGSLARTIGLSPLVVGLTVVSSATSAPELAVTLQAVADGSPEIAIGNVVGSNIANILLILGASAVVVPLLARTQLVRIDIPIMIGMSIAFFMASRDLVITRAEAGILFAALITYIAVAIMVGRAETRRGDEAMGEGEEFERPMSAWLSVVLVAAGVVLLMIGAQFLVAGARSIALSLGLSELVVGLTIVAVGTSLPELATSIIAAVRKERDLAVGNIVGSNIFNIGAVIGLSGLIAGEIPVSESAVALDLPVMLLAAVILLPLAFTAMTIHRWEGVVLVGLYLSYTTYLLLAASDSDAKGSFGFIISRIALPAVLLVVAAGVLSDLRQRRAKRPV